MASFMRTAFPSVDEYKAQVNRYDAGRPTTMTDTKIGNRVVPDGGQRFDPSYDAKAQSLAQGRAPMPAAKDFDASGDYKINSAARMPIGDGRSPLNGGTDLDKMQQGFMRFAANTKNMGEIEQKAQADSQAAQPVRYLGDEGAKLAQTVRSNTPRAPIQMSATQPGQSAAPGVANAPDAKADPTKNAWTGNFAATDANGQGIFTDPKTNRTAIRLTGDAGNKFMQEQGNPPAATAEEMAARRKAMGEYGGIFKQRDAIPATARPGMTLQSSPAAYKRTASAEKVGGFAAKEEFTPQPTPQRTAIPMTGNPLVDQRNAEADLARRQAEIVEIERNTPGLLHAPGTRDYIDPRLPESEQRALSVANAEQRRQDMRDARDNTIAQMQARDAARAYSGLPTDAARNRAMEPYEERRATINQRNANMAVAGEQETNRMAAADKVAEREAKEAQDVRKDATDRYVADRNAELATSNAQISAESKRLDREATMKAALLKLEQTKDPILLEKLKGYNSWLETMMNMPGSEITPEQLAYGQEQYGVAELFGAKAPAVQKPGYK